MLIVLTKKVSMRPVNSTKDYTVLIFPDILLAASPAYLNTGYPAMFDDMENNAILTFSTYFSPKQCCGAATFLGGYDSGS